MISVVLPAYNESDAIESCLAAFRHQTYSEAWELVLVDNNSTDDTCEKAQRAANYYNLPLRTVSEPKQSIAAARQRGFETARHEIIATTDVDARVAPDWLATIGRYFTHYDIVALSGLTVHKGVFGVTSFNRLFQKLHWKCGRPLFFGNNFAVRKTAFYQAGMFNTALYRTEDYDLSLKLGVTYGKNAIHLADDLRIYHHSGNFDLSKAHTLYKLHGFALYLILLSQSFLHPLLRSGRLTGRNT